MCGSLFLLVALLLFLSLSTLLADTNEASLRTGLSELDVCIIVTLVLANRTLFEIDHVLDGQGIGGGLDDVLAGLGGFDIFCRSVTILRLAVAAREEDETLLVFLEALHVGLEALLREILAAGVDGDTDGACELAGNASS